MTRLFRTILSGGIGSVLKISTVINPTLIAVTVLFTGTVGVFFGFYPARKAANLIPLTHCAMNKSDRVGRQYRG